MPEEGKVLKVVTVDGEGEVASEHSQQLPEDPFGKAYRTAGIQEPPFRPEYLMVLAEQHQTHGAALEQKALDVVGTEWAWKALEETDDEGKAEEESSQRDKLDKWLRELATDAKSDLTSHDILHSAWVDLETFGHGCIELSRDPKGELRHWFAMPAHTVRFHRDGVRCMQIRNEKRQWFKRWIPDDERVVNASTGQVFENRKKAPKDAKVANEIFVLKRPSRRSTWYGIPTYITATGWIVLSNAARDDNILFFNNRREPRWAIILENVEDDEDMVNKLLSAMRNELKQPHKNLIIPVSGGGKIRFQQLGDNKGDMSWEKLQDRADNAILLAHRMPGERIGVVRAGPLGGNAVTATTRVYKESFVMPSQSMLSHRVNNLLKHEAGIDNPKWQWMPSELDLTEAEAEQSAAVSGFQGGILTLDEARDRVGLKPISEDEEAEPVEGEEPKEDDRGEKFYWELTKGQPAQPGLNPNAPPADQQQLAALNNQVADQIQALIDGNK